MTNEMIERCARAINEISGGLNYDYRDFCRDAARAVIKELMTPTDEMVVEGSMADHECYVDTPYGMGRKFNAPELIWKAMLTEALEEKP